MLRMLSCILLGLCLCSVSVSARPINEAAKVKRLVNELRFLTDSQTSFMVAAFYAGEKIGMGLSLAGIIWKESSFGKKLVNKSDGKYGSFGLAQILLETAIKRNKVTSKAAKEDLKLRLISDHAFNLRQAVKELSYWKEYYKTRTKYVTTHVVASYNSGWNGYKAHGKAYSDDVKLRRKALVIWLSRKENFNKFKFLKEHLLDINRILTEEGIIKKSS